MEVIHHFGMLAPVPLEHLESGAPVAKRQGYVAFGTQKWELLRKLDQMREMLPVPVLIYPSDEGVSAKLSYRVCWFGWYIGHVQSIAGKHPDGMKHRPPTTAQYPADNSGFWAAFWHVKDLHELRQDKQLPINKVPTLKGGWRKHSPPRGPELVAMPESLSYET